jgi:hypothetical protein
MELRPAPPKGSRCSRPVPVSSAPTHGRLVASGLALALPVLLERLPRPTCAVDLITRFGFGSGIARRGREVPRGSRSHFCLSSIRGASALERRRSLIPHEAEVLLVATYVLSPRAMRSARTRVEPFCRRTYAPQRTKRPPAKGSRFIRVESACRRQAALARRSPRRRRLLTMNAP